MDVCDAQPKHCRSDHRAQTGPRPRLNKTFLIDMQFISQHSFFHSDTKGFSMKETRIHKINQVVERNGREDSGLIFTRTGHETLFYHLF